MRNSKRPESSIVKDDTIDDVTTPRKLFAFKTGARLAPNGRGDLENLVPVDFLTGSYDLSI
jgi:hypothetical protein